MSWTGYPEEDPALYEQWFLEQERQRQPEPTTEEYCGANGHTYHGNQNDCGGDLTLHDGKPCDCGSCYCGEARYDRDGNPLPEARTA